MLVKEPCKQYVPEVSQLFVLAFPLVSAQRAVTTTGAAPNLFFMTALSFTKWGKSLNETISVLLAHQTKTFALILSLHPRAQEGCWWYTAGALWWGSFPLGQGWPTQKDIWAPSALFATTQRGGSRTEGYCLCAFFLSWIFQGQHPECRGWS